jgi:putative PIN family toxin of toxin-antitoxin system
VNGAGRVVFDTSTLVSAALRMGSTPYRVVAMALAAGQICVSAYTLAELERVLARPKFDSYQTLAARLAFFALIRQHAECFEVTAVHQAGATPPCRDPKDTPFLALCLACEANALVSSDEDLLVLHPWNGIPILQPAEFERLNAPSGQ